MLLIAGTSSSLLEKYNSHTYMLARVTSMEVVQSSSLAFKKLYYILKILIYKAFIIVYVFLL